MRMNILIAYLNGLPRAEQDAFAKRCGTSVNYLRKAVSTGQKLGESLCINLDRESGGAVPLDLLRTDVDWKYVRNRQALEPIGPNAC